MPSPAELGVRLGSALVNLTTRSREASAAKLTPAMVQMISRSAEAIARSRARQAQADLEGWWQKWTGTSLATGEVGGLLGIAGTTVGGWGVGVLATAISFGAGMTLSAIVAPLAAAEQQAAWSAHPNQVLAPGELAALVVRGLLARSDAEVQAKRSGIDEIRFAHLTELARARFTVDLVLEARRRELLSDGEAVTRLERLGYDSANAALLLELRTQVPSTFEALDALLEGQTDEATARALYERAGGDPDLFTLLFNTRGQAPTPAQSLDLLNRGIIPERGKGPEATTYEQSFLEGPWRNKWLEPFLALREYVIPPRSVVPLLRSGAITRDRAVELLGMSGVTAEDAQAMTEEAAMGKLAPERELVKTEVLAAYRGGLMKAEEVKAALGDMGYEGDEADLILAIEDHRWERSFRDAAVGRLRGLYVGGKITEDEASSALASLGAGGTAASKYLALWDVERTLPRADLTLAQMQAALRRGIVDEARFREWLTVHGYSPEEVEILVGLTTPA